MTVPIDPDTLLAAYRLGLFPMADAIDDPDVFWVDPDMRGQLPILDIHIPSRLKRTVLAAPYRVTINTAFDRIIDLCAQSTNTRADTWINPSIRQVFCTLHAQRHAHSVECWDGDTLVGGLYGLALGSIFCGESMVSRARDASKIALVHLCARLYHTRFTVLDTQFVNDHLAQFGCHAVPRDVYHAQLRKGLETTCDFTRAPDEATVINAYFQARAQRLPT